MTQFSQYIDQSYRAAKMMASYAEYARSIGCEVYDDEIAVTTDTQLDLLLSKWKELTARANL